MKMPFNKLYISRRKLLASSVVVATSQIATKAAAQSSPQTSPQTSGRVATLIGEDDYQYEVNYTGEQWKERLSEEEFRIMRLGGTEKRKSSPLWEETRDGVYNCKGCDLEVYDSEYKVVLNKGWVFFKHSQPDAVLTKIDFVTSYGGSEKKRTTTEAHCRRCGSHLGHILYVNRQILHCINGTSLNFKSTV